MHERAYANLIDVCLRRVRRWSPPPNWSRRDWLEEAHAHGALAACEADHDFDPARGVPHEAFLYQRIMARVLTRYRQEWSYAGHCAPLDGAAQLATDHSSKPSDITDTIRDFLARLTSRDKWIITKYWDQTSGADIGRELGISQQAVSKRQNVLLRELRGRLKKEKFTGCEAGGSAQFPY